MGYQEIPRLAAKWDHPERLINWSAEPADARDANSGEPPGSPDLAIP
jgi:hypothetical protein